ncbi:phage antirepressor KilAC domain-containing protein [Streptomyces sp. NPDC058614]|uniref:phage antirepressor KilAC domain-containing protein n=1 Tax=Streptomyces sp. NPDC058614 TaxID=3346557 RepID=UPI0036597149
MLLDHNGQERWSARDLQVLMGYDQWRQFDDAVQRAKAAINASGMDAHDHIAVARKVMAGGRWGKQEVADYRLTRFGAYHVTLAGDGRKPEVAAAKTYFAVKTREAELAAQPDVSSPEGVVVLAERYLAAARELVATKMELAVAKPKASKWDAFVNSEGLIGMTAIADMLDMPVKDMTNWLVDEGIFRKQVSKFGSNQNMPRRMYQTSGHFEIKVETNGKVAYEVAYATTQGADFVFDRWQGHAAA